MIAGALMKAAATQRAAAAAATTTQSSTNAEKNLKQEINYDFARSEENTK